MEDYNNKNKVQYGCEDDTNFAISFSTPPSDTQNTRSISAPSESCSTASTPLPVPLPEFRSVSSPTIEVEAEPTFHFAAMNLAEKGDVTKVNSGKMLRDKQVKPISTPPSGWNMNVNLENVRTLPEYFPSKKIITRNAMPMKLLPEVLKRLQQCISSESIQALYIDQPRLEAKLQTLDNCELYLDFWKSLSGDEFYIDISRRRGDHLIASMYINKLLNAAKGLDPSAPSKQQFDKNQVQNFESFLNAAMANAGCTEHLPTPHETEKVIMETIHASLMSDRLDARTSGLKQLVGMTDLKRTMSPAACSASFVVLSGKTKDGFLADMAMDIHEAIMRLIFEKEFLGDDSIFAMEGEDDMDVDDFLDTKPFFPSPVLNRNRPRYYEDNMNELHHMALIILVQALEVATTFDTELSQEIQYFCEKYVTMGLDRLLIGYIDNVTAIDMESQSLSKGYLACKALRIMASSDFFLRNRVMKDAQAKQQIIVAVNVGKASHVMLEKESELLLSTVYVHGETF